MGSAGLSSGWRQHSHRPEPYPRLGTKNATATAYGTPVSATRVAGTAQVYVPAVGGQTCQDAERAKGEDHGRPAEPLAHRATQRHHGPRRYARYGQQARHQRHTQGQDRQALHVDTRMFNTLLRHVRALGERSAAELEQRWRTLQHVTLSPCRIGDIARAALVLNRIWK